jgi:hypothetical protein
VSASTLSDEDATFIRDVFPAGFADPRQEEDSIARLSAFLIARGSQLMPAREAAEYCLRVIAQAALDDSVTERDGTVNDRADAAVKLIDKLNQVIGETADDNRLLLALIRSVAVIRRISTGEDATLALMDRGPQRQLRDMFSALADLRLSLELTGLAHPKKEGAKLRGMQFDALAAVANRYVNTTGRPIEIRDDFTADPGADVFSKFSGDFIEFVRLICDETGSQSLFTRTDFRRLRENLVK